MVLRSKNKDKIYNVYIYTIEICWKELQSWLLFNAKHLSMT